MALEVFYSYAREDEKLRDRLEMHLTLLKREGLITEWHDRRIGAGEEWHGDIDAHVHSAQIILLLVSADFLASEYINDVELKVALDRHARHAAELSLRTFWTLLRELSSRRHRPGQNDQFSDTTGH